MISEVADFLVPALLAMSAFRLIPFVAYMLFSQRIGWRQKLVALATSGLLAGALRWVEGSLLVQLAWAVAAFAYLCSVAVLAHVAAPRLGRSGAALPTFVLLAGLCLAVPAALLPNRYLAMGVVPGWEVMLSAYSYVRECTRCKRRPSLAEGVFFVCVDPVLVFAQRAKPNLPPSARRSGALRVAVGLATLALHLALLSQLNRLGVIVPHGYSAIVGVCGLAFLSQYFGHSGVASVQIGVMRALGYALPERYHFPLLATGPIDFWNRWNTYVGQWLRRYVFQPLALWLRRTALGKFGMASMAAAVLATFLVGGALHDALQVVASGRFPFAVTLAFAVQGAAALVWVSAGHWLASPSPRPSTSTLPQALLLSASRVGLAHVMLASVWVVRAVGSSGVFAIRLSDLL